MSRSRIWLALLASACSVDDVALVGRKCPCPSELACVDGICVEPGSAGAGGSGNAAGSGGAGGSAGSCVPKIVVSDFHVGWETPNTIRWEWSVAGVPADFSAYELITAESAADLASRSGTAKVWTVSENPELGELIVPDSNSPTEDRVEDTISDGHQPKRAYFGQLFAVDSSGCRSSSAAVQAVTTDAPVGEIELFSDAPVPETFPASFELSATGGALGAACLKYVRPECTWPSCYENLKAQGMSISTDGVMIENQFVTKAYLEVSIALSGSTHSYWSQLWLMLADNTDIWKLEPVVARANGEYRTHQIPLRILAQSGVPLSYATFQASGISGFAFGGLFPGGTEVRVDEASIKW